MHDDDDNEDDLAINKTNQLIFKPIWNRKWMTFVNTIYSSQSAHPCNLTRLYNVGPPTSKSLRYPQKAILDSSKTENWTSQWLWLILGSRTTTLDHVIMPCCCKSNTENDKYSLWFIFSIASVISNMFLIAKYLNDSSRKQIEPHILERSIKCMQYKRLNTKKNSRINGINLRNDHEKITHSRKSKNRFHQNSCDWEEDCFDVFDVFFGNRELWMLGKTPPCDIVTPDSILFSSSSFLIASWMCRGIMRDFLLSRAAFPASSRTSAARYSRTAARYTGAPAPILSA